MIFYVAIKIDKTFFTTFFKNGWNVFNSSKYNLKIKLLLNLTNYYLLNFLVRKISDNPGYGNTGLAWDCIKVLSFKT